MTCPDKWVSPSLLPFASDRQTCACPTYLPTCLTALLDTTSFRSRQHYTSASAHPLFAALFYHHCWQIQFTIMDVSAFEVDAIDTITFAELLSSIPAPVRRPVSSLATNMKRA